MRRTTFTALLVLLVLAPLAPALAAICSDTAQAPAHACCAKMSACSNPQAKAERSCCSAASSSGNLPADTKPRSQIRGGGSEDSLTPVPAVSALDAGTSSLVLVARLHPLQTVPAISLPLRR